MFTNLLLALISISLRLSSLSKSRPYRCRVYLLVEKSTQFPDFKHYWSSSYWKWFENEASFLVFSEMDLMCTTYNQCTHLQGLCITREAGFFVFFSTEIFWQPLWKNLWQRRIKRVTRPFLNQEDWLESKSSLHYTMVYRTHSVGKL